MSTLAAYWREPVVAWTWEGQSYRVRRLLLTCGHTQDRPAEAVVGEGIICADCRREGEVSKFPVGAGGPA